MCQRPVPFLICENEWEEEEEEEEKEEEDQEEEDQEEDDYHKIELLATTVVLHDLLRALPIETQETLHEYCKNELGAFLLYTTNVMKLSTMEAMIAANYFLRL